jgi:phospho-N-acetylmuramoyl-pentapeptide-transferase
MWRSSRGEREVMGATLADAALTVLLAAVASIVCGRLMIPALARAQGMAPRRYDDCPPLAKYQEAKRRTPSMGGVFVLAAASGAAALGGGLRHRDGWLVLFAIVALGATGLCDDWLKFRGENAVGLRSMPKLAVALAVGAALGVIMTMDSGSHGTLEFPWVRRTVDLGWGLVPFAMLVTAGCAHAVNLSDGMDGLAAGCVGIALAAAGLWAMQQDDPRSRALVMWCAALAGACLGFLWFNSFPATIFLGDVGALGLGAGLAAVSLLGHTALWLPIIGGVFVLEALSVMLQVASYRWRNKRRIFRVAPLHHHFHLGGVAEPKLTVRFWIVGVLLAMLGLTTVLP